MSPLASPQLKKYKIITRPKSLTSGNKEIPSANKEISKLAKFSIEQVFPNKLTN